MAGNWSGRLSRRPQDMDAQAALDGAVSAFLDLDNRQSYVADAMAAMSEITAPMDVDGSAHGSVAGLSREWGPVAQQCLDASGRYLEVAAQYSLTDSLDRPTGVDPTAARAAFIQVHRGLAEAAAAVDRFYQKHARALEDARGKRAATPLLSAQAREAASGAERALTKAESDGLDYPSVLDAAGDLITAMAALNAAESSGKPGEIRQAAGAVQGAVKLVTDRIATAGTLLPAVRGSISSVKTRIEVVTGRLESLPATQSALLREFSADSSKDLDGSGERARSDLARARTQWHQAEEALADGQPEQAADHLAGARAALAAAEGAHSALTERLRKLRETKADPKAAAKSTRFRLRDAQLLVVNRSLIKEWGSVLDAQGARIDRAEAELTGPHPNYWAYLQALSAVEAFVKGVVERVRGEIR